MKLIALLIVCLIWLFVLSLMKIRLNFTYRFEGFSSNVVLDFKMLFSHLKIELNIPKEMYSEGLANFFGNVIEDLSAEEEYQVEQTAHPPKRKAKRYSALKDFTREVFRHYVSSLSRVIWLKRKVFALRKYLYKKVNVYSIQVAIKVGGRDAAETGLLVGAFWAFFGQMTARLYRLVTIKKKDIRYSVSPCFDDEIFLCQLHCILSLKISHIIFTGYKFLLIIFKNRRTKNHGRTSN